MLGRDPAQRLGEAGVRRHDAHVAGGGLGDDARDAIPVRREDGVECGDVVVGHDEGLGSDLGGHAGRVGERQGGDAGARADEEGVDVAVVVAGELHDEAAPREPPGEADGAHRRLGAAGDQAHLLDGGDPRDDLLGEQHLVL